jgi:hypothetical protein
LDSEGVDLGSAGGADSWAVDEGEDFVGVATGAGLAGAGEVGWGAADEGEDFVGVDGVVELEELPYPVLPQPAATSATSTTPGAASRRTALLVVIMVVIAIGWPSVACWRSGRHPPTAEFCEAGR